MTMLVWYEPLMLVWYEPLMLVWYEPADARLIRAADACLVEPPAASRRRFAGTIAVHASGR
jgi:hypothetical protein